MSREQKAQITRLAQNGVDEILNRSRKSGVETVAALQVAILTCRETIHWAEEAIDQIRKGQK